MADKRYFQLLDEHGLSPFTGKPDLITRVGLVVAVPTMVQGEVVREIQRTEIEVVEDAKAENVPARVLPGSRIVETSDVKYADALLQSEQYREIDPPKKPALDKHRKQLAANVADDKAARAEHEEGGEAA